MDWDKLKREYVTGQISYRKLAEKYGVPFGTLKHNAKVGNWCEERTRYRDRVNTKSIAKAEAKATDYKSMLYDLALKVAGQLNDMTDSMSISDLAAIGVKPRDITGAIKDLEDALHVKSASDLKEQEARIAKLNREAEGNKNDSGIQVIISADAEKYSE